jgi:GGDEF domain-containing protein
LFVDLDGFKIFNDTMGPSVGNQILVESGHRIEAGLRDEDTVARPENQLATRIAVLSRMGGDEFTILLEGITDPSDAMRVAQRILSGVAQPLLVEAANCTPRPA